MLDNLDKIPADPLLKLMSEFASDKRSEKIDLGVGVYRDDQGQTTVMKAVKLAEEKILNEQLSKSYVGLAGDEEFIEDLRELTFGKIPRYEGRLTGIQTPGGSAALRLAGDIIFRSHPEAKIWVGLPSWANHIPIFKAAGLSIETYKRFDFEKSKIDFQSVLSSLAFAKTGDVILLQGCCHNPTGADFTGDEWKAIADVCNQKGLIPLVDIAYQGLGHGLSDDVASLDVLLDRIPEAFVTISCSKTFGLYRERTGALFILGTNHRQADIARSNLFSIARTNYGMPPDHGAAVVKTILRDKKFMTIWSHELNDMRERIVSMRHVLASELEVFDKRFDYLKHQRGMFSLLPINEVQVEKLKRQHGIYMAGNGRINIAGLNSSTAVKLAQALIAVFNESET